jgi:hypothetical protein
MMSSTMTTKRRMAREWLIFLAAITLGLLITYSVFYLGRNATWDYVQADEKRIPEHQRWLIREINGFEFEGRPMSVRYFSKPKNPGDLVNDLFGQSSIIGASRIRLSVGGHENALKLWLCVLSPYFVFVLVRSILWSVKTVRRP